MSIIKLSGWRFGVFVAGLVGAVGCAIYPIIISPMIDPSPYGRSTLISTLYYIFYSDNVKRTRSLLNLQYKLKKTLGKE